MKKISIFLTAVLASGMITVAEEATDVRTWKSTDGRTIIGRANALEGDMVTIILTSNKTVKFSISKLEIKHQMFVKDHFGSELDIEDTVEEASNKVELKVPVKAKRGKKGRRGGALTTVKQDSVEGSFYLHYVPLLLPVEILKMQVLEMWLIQFT